ncbi:MAG: hypothetical protein NEA02_01310 [Thermoanaerobaculia bacterium]|nr:hypothetical protein [Thermoanaerobaculia bacterium]
MRCVYGALAMLLVGLSLRVSASENLVKNGSFDRDIEGWNALGDGPGHRPYPGKVTWSSLDAGARSSSGSMELRTSAVDSRDRFDVMRCIPLPSSAKWVRFGGRIRVPSGQPVAGAAFLHLEFSTEADCSNQSGRQSSLGGISNFDGWSKREEVWPVPSNSNAARFIAAVFKKYEWQEGAQTDDLDDGEEFLAFFDDLFLIPATEPKGPKEPPPQRTAFFDAESSRGTPTLQRHGKDVVAAPKLQLKVTGESTNGKKGVPEILSRANIGLDVALVVPRDADGDLTYPVQELAAAASNNSFNWGRRPTLELAVYRRGDPERRLIQVRLDESSSGIWDSASHAGLSVHIVADRNSRLKAIRTALNCLRRGLPKPEREPTDEELLNAPLSPYMEENARGDFEIVARYEALEAGFWHDPVLSEPFRIRIVQGPPPCPEKLGGQ